MTMRARIDRTNTNVGQTKYFARLADMTLYEERNRNQLVAHEPMIKTLSSDGTKSDAYELLRLHTLVENCPDIPKRAREADVAHVEDRLLDESLFRKITENPGQGETDELQANSVQRRMKSLAPFIGRRLVCMVIRLPGVRYTIEIDPMDERIVHWEWQSQ